MRPTSYRVCFRLFSKVVSWSGYRGSRMNITGIIVILTSAILLITCTINLLFGAMLDLPLMKSYLELYKSGIRNHKPFSNFRFEEAGFALSMHPTSYHICFTLFLVVIDVRVKRIMKRIPPARQTL